MLSICLYCWYSFMYGWSLLEQPLMPFFKLFWAILVSSELVICFSYQFCLQVIGGNKGDVVALVEGLKRFVPFFSKFHQLVIDLVQKFLRLLYVLLPSICCLSYSYCSLKSVTPFVPNYKSFQESWRVKPS